MQPTPSAAYRRRASRSVTANAHRSPFDIGLANFAIRLRESVPNQTAYEHGLLEEFARGASAVGEIRYRQTTLKALIAIAARSKCPADRDALPELIRAEILAAGPPLCVATAFDSETAATGPADVEQRAFEQNPNPITKARVVTALRQQIAASLTALTAVLTCRTWD